MNDLHLISANKLLNWICSIFLSLFTGLQVSIIIFLKNPSILRLFWLSIIFFGKILPLLDRFLRIFTDWQGSIIFLIDNFCTYLHVYCCLLIFSVYLQVYRRLIFFKIPFWWCICCNGTAKKLVDITYEMNFNKKQQINKYIKHKVLNKYILSRHY